MQNAVKLDSVFYGNVEQQVVAETMPTHSRRQVLNALTNQGKTSNLIKSLVDLFDPALSCVGFIFAMYVAIAKTSAFAVAVRTIRAIDYFPACFFDKRSRSSRLISSASQAATSPRSMSACASASFSRM